MFFFYFLFFSFHTLRIKNLNISWWQREKKKGNKKKKKKRRADDFGNFRDELSDIFPFFIALLISWLTLEFPEVSNEFIIKSY